LCFNELWIYQLNDERFQAYSTVLKQPHNEATATPEEDLLQLHTSDLHLIYRQAINTVDCQFSGEERGEMFSNLARYSLNNIYFRLWLVKWDDFPVAFQYLHLFHTYM